MLLVSGARPSIMRYRRRTSGFGNSRWEQPTRTSRGVVGVQDAQGTRTVGRIAQSPVFRALLQVATTCRPSYGRSFDSFKRKQTAMFSIAPFFRALPNGFLNYY